jgi:Icc-related predicted phosphoesterase
MPGVSVYVVSDLHGASDALKKAVPEGTTLVLLGDLVNFIDYSSMTGILIDVFSTEAVQQVIDLRSEGDFEEAGRIIRERAVGREEEVRAEIGARVREQCEQALDAAPDPTYLIFGNIDHPGMVSKLAAEHSGVVLADGNCYEIEGESFGFVGGALPTPMHVAGEITEEEMAAKVAGLGDCDVLCSHIPPAVPEFCYDLVAKKAERGSTDLLRYIEDVQPRRAYFGHVHQPLLSAMHIGRTLCVNVGYFRKTKRAYPHRKEGEGGNQ